jgi:hypothetical protein
MTEIRQAFAGAARRAVTIGIDLIQLHAAILSDKVCAGNLFGPLMRAPRSTTTLFPIEQKICGQS